jgi:Fibronectin type III domain
VRENPSTTVRCHIPRSLLALTQRSPVLARVILLILFGSNSFIPAMGQTTTGAPPVSASSVTLKWDKSSGREVKGYRLHYGTAPGDYRLSTDAGKKTTCKISNLTVGKKYYFVVVAYDARGNESPPSNECTFVASPSNSKKRH